MTQHAEGCYCIDCQFGIGFAKEGGEATAPVLPDKCPTCADKRTYNIKAIAPGPICNDGWHFKAWRPVVAGGAPPQPRCPRCDSTDRTVRNRVGVLNRHECRDSWHDETTDVRNPALLAKRETPVTPPRYTTSHSTDVETVVSGPICPTCSRGNDSRSSCSDSFHISCGKDVGGEATAPAYGPCRKTVNCTLGDHEGACNSGERPVRAATPPVLGTCAETNGDNPHIFNDRCVGWRPVASGGAPPQPEYKHSQAGTALDFEGEIEYLKKMDSLAERETPVTSPPQFPDCNVGTDHECCVARMKRLEKERYGVTWAPEATPSAQGAETIDDGVGNVWSAYCSQCGRKSMQICRAGDARCAYCYDNPPESKLDASYLLMPWLADEGFEKYGSMKKYPAAAMAEFADFVAASETRSLQQQLVGALSRETLIRLACKEAGIRVDAHALVNERAEAAESNVGSLQQELARFRTVTDHARGGGVKDSGPGDLQAWIEARWAELEQARPALLRTKNRIHLAWTDKATLREICEAIEADCKQVLDGRG